MCGTEIVWAGLRANRDRAKAGLLLGLHGKLVGIKVPGYLIKGNGHAYAGRDLQEGIRDSR
jgi:hypothetical protein